MIKNSGLICFKSFNVIFENHREINIPLEVGSSNVDLTTKPFNVKGGAHYKIKIGYMSTEPIQNLLCQIHTFKKSMPFGRDTQKLGNISGNQNDLEFIFPKFGWDDASTSSSAMGDYTIKLYFKCDNVNTNNKDNNADIATFIYSFNIAPDWENALPVN